MSKIFLLNHLSTTFKDYSVLGRLKPPWRSIRFKKNIGNVASQLKMSMDVTFGYLLKQYGKLRIEFT